MNTVNDSAIILHFDKICVKFKLAATDTSEPDLLRLKKSRGDGHE